MDNLLFESKGINTSSMLKMKIHILITFCISILMFVLINIEVEKKEYFTTRMGYYKVHLIANESDRILFFLIGLGLISYSITGLFVIAKLNKVYLKIYDNCIQGVTFTFANRSFKYFYNEIKHVDKHNSSLIIYTNVGKIGISINGDIDNAYTIIQDKIHD